MLSVLLCVCESKSKTVLIPWPTQIEGASVSASPFAEAVFSRNDTNGIQNFAGQYLEAGSAAALARKARFAKSIGVKRTVVSGAPNGYLWDYRRPYYTNFVVVNLKSGGKGKNNTIKFVCVSF